MYKSVDILVLFSVTDTSGWTLKGDITSGLRIDIHKRDNDRDSCAVDVPEQGLALNNEKAELDEIMASSMSYDEHGQMHPDEFEDVSLTLKGH